MDSVYIKEQKNLVNELCWSIGANGHFRPLSSSLFWSVFTVSCVKTFDSVTHIWIMLLSDY